MQEQVMNMMAGRRGHFLLESGHHGDLWLDLEVLYRRPKRVDPLARELGRRLASHKPDTVCGPLVEGAFVALTVASALDVEYTYAERFSRSATKTSEGGLFPAGYRIPPAARSHLRGKRVAIVNDVTNAGSSVMGTYSDLKECGATVVAVGALLVLGSAADAWTSREGIALETLARDPNSLWPPDQCPLCKTGMPLSNPGQFLQ